MELRFLIPMVSGIQDALSLIPDPKAQDSRLHKDSGIRIVSHGASVILSRFFYVMVSCHVTCHMSRVQYKECQSMFCSILNYTSGNGRLSPLSALTPAFRT